MEAVPGPGSGHAALGLLGAELFPQHPVNQCPLPGLTELQLCECPGGKRLTAPGCACRAHSPGATGRGGGGTQWGSGEGLQGGQQTGMRKCMNRKPRGPFFLTEEERDPTTSISYS